MYSLMHLGSNPNSLPHAALGLFKTRTPMLSHANLSVTDNFLVAKFSHSKR